MSGSAGSCSRSRSGWRTEIEQPTSGGVLRLVRDEIRPHAAAQGKLRRGRTFTASPWSRRFPIDYEVANWFTSTYPASRFRNNLLIERLTPEVRVSLFNRRLTRRRTDGAVEEAVLE